VDALNSAHLIVALMMAGTALIFSLFDWKTRSTRALSFCLAATGVAVLIGDQEVRGTYALAVLGNLFEGIAILSGLEWGRRVSLTAPGRARAAANGLFIAAQIVALIYIVLALGYVFVLPKEALQPGDGVVESRALEIAVGAPLLGTVMLCAAIAITLMRFMQIDRAEMARLRALFWAGPFLLAGLAVSDRLVPLTLTIGLLIFLAGSVGYFVIQSSRGAFMQQFLSPDVARMVQSQGADAVLKRESRPVSIVVCDLRGFTAFAAAHDSDKVASVLESFYGVVGRVAAKYGGTVKDHAGDGVLMLVGAPIAFDDHAVRAARMAVELVQQGRPLLGEIAPGVGLGIGVACGNTTVGAIRGASRLEYVAVGNAVNLAARLCQRAEDGEVLASMEIAAAIPDAGISARAAESLKGFAEPVPVFALAG
jgi:adenylate cyclase